MKICITTEWTWLGFLLQCTRTLTRPEPCRQLMLTTALSSTRTRIRTRTGHMEPPGSTVWALRLTTF